MRVSHALSLQTYLLILFASVGHNARHTQGAMLRGHEKGTSLFVCTALDVCFRDSTQAVCCLLSILIVRASVLFCYQGDAAFWHNMLRSGEGDFRTRHAGCPVLKGWKWGKFTWGSHTGATFISLRGENLIHWGLYTTCDTLWNWMVKNKDSMKRPDHARLHDTGVTFRTEVRTFIHSFRIAKQVYTKALWTVQMLRIQNNTMLTYPHWSAF